MYPNTPFFSTKHGQVKDRFNSVQTCARWFLGAKPFAADPLCSRC